MTNTRSDNESGFVTMLWQWVRRPGWSVAILSLIIIFIGIFAWQVFFARSSIDKGLMELKTAYREQRPLEARISGFSYAPYVNGTVKVIDTRWKVAEGILMADPLQPPIADSQHARGKFLLANRRFDEAIQLFEAAIASDASNAALHNDLGVAWLEKAKSENKAQTHAYATSQQHTELARKLDPSLNETFFNLALLYHRQGWWRQAKEQWELYIKNDPRSRWAEEARSFLKEVEKQLQSDEKP